MATDVFEAKNFSNLTHWQSLAWHGAPRDHWKGSHRAVGGRLLANRAVPAPPQGWLECLGISGWLASESPAGMDRNHRLEWIGITGWFASEYAAEIARLRRECDRLRMERDILKKSISIFAGPLR